MKDPHGLGSDKFGNGNQPFTIVKTSPSGPHKFPVESLPPEVTRAFEEAENSFAAGNWSAAAVMYRKAIERSARLLDKDGSGMLHTRIRALEANRALPHSLIELMDLVRFLGNDGAHDDIDPDQVEVERGRDFTRLFLTYVWELPARIEAAKAERNGKG